MNNSSFWVTTLDLVTDADALNFEVNQKIVTSGTLSGGSVRSGSLTVSAVDRDATSNQVTTSANLSGITGIAQNDFIYVEGNYDNGEWVWQIGFLPSSPPSSGDPLFGQDRSSDPTRLGGQRVAALQPVKRPSSMVLEGQPEKVDNLITFLFPSQTSLLWKRNWNPPFNVKLTPILEQVSVQWKCMPPYGVAKIIPDKDCPVGIAYALQMDTWHFATIGEPVSIIDADGNRILRQSSADGVEVRVGFYGQLACTAPGFNCRIALA